MGNKDELALTEIKTQSKMTEEGPQKTHGRRSVIMEAETQLMQPQAIEH